MRFASLLALAAISLVASPSLAGEKKPVDPNKKVCRRQQVTGSNLHAFECHTNAQWDAIDAASADAARQTLNRQNGGAER
jgi:hypothetical protein